MADTPVRTAQPTQTQAGRGAIGTIGESEEKRRKFLKEDERKEVRNDAVSMAHGKKGPEERDLRSVVRRTTEIAPGWGVATPIRYGAGAL